VRAIRGSVVYLAEDIRRILESLQLARPDLSEGIALVAVALGIAPCPRRSDYDADLGVAPWSQRALYDADPDVVNAEWRRVR
jgi:hypothetical protein